MTTGTETYKAAFLDLFPTDCQEDCIVAKMAAALAAKQMVEQGLTFQKVSEVVAHRFGRCAVGPNVQGRCGKKSICNNELVEEVEDIYEARDVLAQL